MTVQAGHGVRQAVAGPDRGQLSIGSDMPTKDAVCVRVDRVQVAGRRRTGSSSRKPGRDSTAVPAVASASVSEPSVLTSKRDTAPSAQLVAYAATEQRLLGIAAGVPIEVGVQEPLVTARFSVTANIYGHLLEGVGHQAAEAAAALVPRGRAKAV